MNDQLYPQNVEVWSIIIVNCESVGLFVIVLGLDKIIKLEHFADAIYSCFMSVLLITKLTNLINLHDSYISLKKFTTMSVV